MSIFIPIQTTAARAAISAAMLLAKMAYAIRITPIKYCAAQNISIRKRIRNIAELKEAVQGMSQMRRIMQEKIASVQAKSYAQAGFA